MMSLAVLHKILAEKEITDDYFLRLHFCIEAIIRRLFLIGLRLEGVQFRIAQTIVNEFPAMGLETHMKKVFDYCGIDYSKLEAHSKYIELEKLFFNFTSCWRNRRVHGLISNITDTELLKLLINADKLFIKELEAMLKKMGKPSFFDSPKKWGAKRISNKNIPVFIQKLYNKKSKSPMSKEDVAKIMKNM